MNTIKIHFKPARELYMAVIMAAFFSTAYSQSTSRMAFKWKKPGPFVEIPEQFKNEDAVAIYNQQGVKNEFYVTNAINYRASYFIKRKIRILTASGLNEYSNISIRKRGTAKVATLDARTIKKDGKTIVISSDDIKLLRTYDDVRDVYYHEYRIAIPGVEVGDEIEYIYTSYNDGLSLADDVYLHSNIACMESSFELTWNRPLRIDAYGINEMPAPSLSDDEKTKIMSWSLKNIPSIKNQNYCIPDLEFPYIQYRISNYSISEWSQLYDIISRNSYDHNSKTRGLESYFKSYKSILDKMNAVDKVKFFVNKINTDFDLLEDENEDCQLRPMLYSIEQKKIDEPTLMLFYRYMFYYLQIPFETCFGKNRYDGDLFPQIISSHQITHVFYSFKDESQINHYLFLSNAHLTYSPDERPFSLENTKVIYLKKQDPFSEDKPVVQIHPIERQAAGNNNRTVTCAYQISPDWHSALCDIKLNFTGMSSLRYRTGWMNQIKDYKKDDFVEWLGEKDNKTFELDTVYPEPVDNNLIFKAAFRIKSKENDVTTAAGENINSLKVKIPLEHKTIATYSFARITDIYMPYQLNDELTYFIQFPAGVAIINEKDLVKSLFNEAGNFTMSITKVNDTLFKIVSTYKIKATRLPKEKYKMLVELNEMVDQTKELNVLFKKL